MVGHQGFDGFAGLGAFLDLVEDDEGFARCKLLLVVKLDVLQEGVNVFQIFIEPAFDSLSCLAEIDENVGIVFVLCEFLCNVTLTNTARTFNHKACSAVFLLLPLEEQVVYLSFHNHVSEVFREAGYTPFRDF